MAGMEIMHVRHSVVDFILGSKRMFDKSLNPLNVLGNEYILFSEQIVGVLYSFLFRMPTQRKMLIHISLRPVNFFS